MPVNAILEGRYRIEREIGRGGMATVYLADDARHRRKVALKLLLPELAAAVGPERFLREIEIAAQLSHPHIVPLYDSGDADGQLYYVMPFIDGETLRQRLDREGQLPIEDVIRITQQVGSALDYAHARNVVHRDIKPENILLYEGEALLADFGIAAAVRHAGSGRITGTGVVVGTPVYMSPEQALGEETDKRSDLYSLGCVTYEMLAGEPPHLGPNAQSIIAKRVTDPVPSVRRLRPAVPLAVEQAVSRAIAKYPSDRFASLAQFAAALRAPVKTETPTVAVLPFRNLSSDRDNEYFADGITEDVIAHLSKIRSLKVLSRASVMPFKDRRQGIGEIAASLGATTVLDGSVRRAGDRVRIVATLMDPVSDTQLWVETYDRQLTDIFAIQTDVALHIVEALRAGLTRDEQTRVSKEATSDVEAYQLYLRGRQWLVKFTPQGYRRAIELYEAAIARDPRYAHAHAALAMAYVELSETGTIETTDARRRARAEADMALRLDPDLGPGHTSMGYLKTAIEYDWAGAEWHFKRALELCPGNADVYDLYARLCNALRRFDEALTLLERAVDLDPLTHKTDIIGALLRVGRFEDAIRRGESLVDVYPDIVRAHATLGWACFLGGQQERGIAQLERACAEAPGHTLWLGQLGQIYGLAGQHERAREVLHQLEQLERQQFVSPYHFAYVYTGLGEHDRAVEMLERAIAARTGATYGINGSFLLAPLRGHPRFQALLRTMNLA
jgi:serine/threonine-protein kinase